MNCLLVASLLAAAVSFTPGQSDIVIAPDACEAGQVAAAARRLALVRRETLDELKKAIGDFNAIFPASPLAAVAARSNRSLCRAIPRRVIRTGGQSQM